VLYQVIPGFEIPTGTTLAVPNPSAWTAYQGNTLETILSTRAKELEINDAILNQAEADAPKSGYETRQFFTLAVDEQTGKARLNTADLTDLDASQAAITALETNKRPVRTGYSGYLVGDGIPPNGAPFTAGIAFPLAPSDGQFCLRKDYFPYRLFRFNGIRWIKVEDKVRMTMNNLGESDVGVGDQFAGKDVRKTQKAGFINNTNTDTINGHTVKERQSLSKALRPEADE
jgi:hypothetical protein